MNTSQIMNLINELEDRYAVDRWSVAGIDLWPFLRIRLNFDLCYAYQQSMPSPGETVHALSVLKNTARFCAATVADLRKNRMPRGRSDVVLMSDGLSFSSVNGSWYEKFCDPLIERFRARGLSTLLLTPSHAHRIPRHTPSVFIQPCLDAIMINRWLRTDRAATSAGFASDYPEYSAYLESKRLLVTALPQQAVQRYAAIIRDMAHFFRKLLARTGARLGFVVCYYSLEGMAFCLACRQLGIPSVDLQHGGGLEDDLHVAYARWNKVPPIGYGLLPSFFWCWSTSDADMVKRWNGAAASWHRPVVGGNLWMNDWRSGAGLLVAEYDTRMRALIGADGRRQMLVTLQFGLADERTLAPLLDVIRRSQREWRWWVRLHPVMLKERERIRRMLARHAIVECELDAASDLPLYALLRHMDLHFTHSSSTVFEAAEFGIPSIILSEYGSEFYPRQIAEGKAYAAYTAPDILTACRALLDRRPDMGTSIPTEEAFELMVSLANGSKRREAS